MITVSAVLQSVYLPTVGRLPKISGYVNKDDVDTKLHGDDSV